MRSCLREGRGPPLAVLVVLLTRHDCVLDVEQDVQSLRDQGVILVRRSHTLGDEVMVLRQRRWPANASDSL